MKKSFNTLIAGVIGSGKSYTEKALLRGLLDKGPCQLVLIDPKQVELMEFQNLPETLYYADSEDGICSALESAEMIMENRFSAMKAAKKTETEEPPIFIVVDEMAFLMQSDRKKEYVRILNRITLLGRAADMHLILCSQVSTQDVIPACIRDNMTNIVCLRQRDAGKYRYLLGDFPGRLPTIGYCYLFTPDMARPEKIESKEVFRWIN